MVVPIRADVPVRSVPIGALGLAAANLVVFVCAVAAGPEAGAIWVERFALVPRELLRAASDPPLAPWREWLTPLTSMFLHGSLVHLLSNLFFLWMFGAQVEELLGHGRFLVFYLACGLAAAAIHVASDPASYVPTVGASGAISGLLGAYAVSYPSGRLRLLWPPTRVPAIAFLGLWIGLQVASGLDPAERSVAWWAHVGGFAAGAALARAMWIRTPTRSRLRI